MESNLAGALDVYAASTHGVGPAVALRRLQFFAQTARPYSFLG